MISLQHVSKTYRNGVEALQDVSVEVEKGEFIFVVGQSGSGKSTMIRLLLKEEEATAGAIYVGGKNLAKMSAWDVPKLRRNVGTVFQDYKLLTDKTVFENVRSRWRSSASRNTSSISACRRSWTTWAWGRSSTTTPTNCPAASSSAYPSRAPA